MKILIVNQAFYPDQSASSQYVNELALELVKRGHQISVVTANKGYLNQNEKYQTYEEINGIKVIRASSVNYRNTKVLRILSAIWTNFSLLLKVITSGAHDKTIVLTSPPMLGFFISFLPKSIIGELIHWALDINPDQAIKAKWIKNNIVIAILLKLQKIFFARCNKIIVLDRFMQELLLSKGVEKEKLVVCSLWWSKVNSDDHISNTTNFRIKNNLQDKKIIMYAGNHSICHPLDRLLDIALEMRNNLNFAFVFVGSGYRVDEVLKFKEKHRLDNILHFDYVPNNDLIDLLSSADVHVVSQGSEYVGIVHPSKIYGIIAHHKPILIFSPEVSSVTEICKDYKLAHLSENVEKDIAWIKSIINCSKAEMTKLSTDLKHVTTKYDKNLVFNKLAPIILS
jgi:colanic acid biosynthesis glycosyl transferase WcaI